MPLYPFVDENTGYEFEVMRTFDDYRVPPKDEELPEEERGKDRKWKRIIKGNVSVNKAPGWGGKGYW